MKNLMTMFKFIKTFFDYSKAQTNVCTHVQINPKEIIKKSKQQTEYKLEKLDYFVSMIHSTPIKDIETLISAYNLFLKNTNSRTKLFLLDLGKNEKSIRKFTRDLNLDEDVIFCGEQKNPYPFIKNAKACIFSSKNETAASFLLKTMILKTLPICDDDSPCLKELLDKGNNGILFPSKDIQKLAKIMEKIDMGFID